MIDPVAKAKWVLAAKSVGEIPALSLAAIADSEGIAHRSKTYPDEWDGMLIFKGDKRAILVNTRIDSKGRHHFTFAHELGHYFLEHQPNYSNDRQLGIRCTLSDTNYEQKGREAEANRFAVELLMPEDSFQLDMAGAPIDFDLFRGLSDKYMVSKHASSNRVLDLTLAPCIVIVTHGNRVAGCKASRAARSFLRQLKTIPDATAALDAITRKKGQEDFYECAADKWLARSVPGQKIYECTRGSFGNGVAMTILKW